MPIIACGVFDKRYINFLIAFILVTILLQLTLFILKNNDGNCKDNKLLIMLIMNFGQIFFIIPDKIINKSPKEKNEEDLSNEQNCDIINKKKELRIEYIFNKQTKILNLKDLLILIFNSILLIIVDFIKVCIETNSDKINTKEDQTQIILNENYNFVEFTFIVVFARFMLKMILYKHQLFSFILVILLGLVRYILKRLFDKGSWGGDITNILICQAIAAFLESMTIIYTKGLMEYKYFTPFKACYVFGTINSFIIIVFLIIFTFIKHSGDKNWFFSLNLDDDNNNTNNTTDTTYYLDNIASILGYGFNLIILLFTSIFYGMIKLLINSTINRFTVYHIFLLFLNKEFTCIIFEFVLYSSEESKAKYYAFIIIIVCHFIEFFAILIFLELIEIKVWGFDENLKRNITERANLETQNSLKDIRTPSEFLDESIYSMKEMNESTFPKKL